MASSARAAQGDERQRAHGRNLAEKVVEVVEVKRYWPGKAPKWSGDPAGDAEEGLGFAQVGAQTKSDPRLERLIGVRGKRQKSEAAVIDSGSDDDEEAASSVRRRRQRTEAEVLEGLPVLDRRGDDGGLARGAGAAVAVLDQESDQVESDDEIEARRERLRQVARNRRAREAEEAKEAETNDVGDGGEDDDEEEDLEGGSESSEYETDTDDEDETPSAKMLKPVFIASTDRETIKEREAEEAQEEAMRLAREERAKERKEESRALLVEAVRKDEMGGEEKAIDFEEMPDDNDEVDELSEFEHWKVGFRNVLTVRASQSRDPTSPHPAPYGHASAPAPIRCESSGV